nr:MAG TPA: hypothetical protein [Caudoviricetes sp.]
MYLPETAPLLPIEPGDPDYDPFCKKFPPPSRLCSCRSLARACGSVRRAAPSSGRSAADTRRSARNAGRK